MLSREVKQRHYLLTQPDEPISQAIARLGLERPQNPSFDDLNVIEEIDLELMHVEAPLTLEQRSLLGVTAFRALELETFVEKKTTDDVNLVCDLVSKYREWEDTPVSDVVIAGMITAELSHWGVKRDNGTDYYTHVAATASILQSAISLYGSRLSLDSNRHDRILFTAYTHDAFEDLLQADGSTFIKANSPIIPSMHFITKLFQSLGRNDGTLVADMVFRITKMRQTGKKISDEMYHKIILADTDTTLVKLADNTHNDRLDPKGTKAVDPTAVHKNLERSRKYDLFRSDMLVGMGTTPLDEQLIAHHIANVAPDHLRRYIRDKSPKRPMNVIKESLKTAVKTTSI